MSTNTDTDTDQQEEVMVSHPPVDFPDAILFEGGLRFVNVLVAKDTVQRFPALHSPTQRVYVLHRHIKEAIYGFVYPARVVTRISDDPLVYAPTPVMVAVKAIDKAKVASINAEENPVKEMAVASFLSDNPHPNVMGHLECLTDSSHYYIVMEFFGGGEVFDMLTSVHHFTEPLARQYFTQLVNGVEYLHNHDVYHRDLSLENVLLSQDRRRVQIIDFGMSLRFARDADGNPLPFPPIPPCGKEYYAAPEVIANISYAGPEADVWALGVMLFLMVVGAPPVSRAWRYCPRYCEVVEGRMREMVTNWGVTYVSDDVLDLIELILREDPYDRLSLEKIKSHTWMNQI